MCAGACGAAGEDPGTEGVSGEEREVGREEGLGRVSRQEGSVLRLPYSGL